MDKTDMNDHTIDVPQGSRIRHQYGAFNELPYGKTIEDVPEMYRWLFSDPIQTSYDVNVIRSFVHDSEVIRGESRRTEGVVLQIDTIFPDRPSIQLVIRRQTLIELPWIQE